MSAGTSHGALTARAASLQLEPAPERSGRTESIVGVLSACGIVVALQQTMVVPLLPDFPAILGSDRASVGWLVTVTLLAGAISAPVATRLADMFGKRRMIILCLAATVVGSAVAALGGSVATVVAGRAIQGLAFAQIPIGISVMRDELPRDKVPSAVALMIATLGIGSAIGLPLSGVIYEHAGWRAVFWTSVIAAALLAVLVVAVVPESTICTRGTFDVIGAVMLSAALGCLLLAISRAASWGWAGERTLLLLAVSGIAFAAWVPLELRVSRPLVDLRTSAARPVVVTNVAAFFVGFAMYANILTTTQQLQMPVASGHGFGVSVLVAGLCMLPSGLAMVALAPVSASITGRCGAKVTLVVGAVLLAIGYVARALLTAEIWQLVVGALVASMGTALAFAAMPMLIMRAVPITETASANGLSTLLRSIGTSVCSAVVVAVLATSPTQVGRSTMPSIDGFWHVFWLAAVAALIAAALAAILPAARTALAAPAIGAAEIVVGGTVRGVDGKPIRHAVATFLGAEGQPADWSRADNDGRYSVVLPGPGRYIVVVAADGWAPRSQILEFTAPTDREQLRLVDPLMLRGQVVAEVGPLDGALVSVTRPTGESVAVTRTDGHGEYAIPLPPTGRYILTVVTPDRCTAQSRQVLILNTQSHTIDVLHIGQEGRSYARTASAVQPQRRSGMRGPDATPRTASEMGRVPRPEPARIPRTARRRRPAGLAHRHRPDDRFCASRSG